MQIDLQGGIGNQLFMYFAGQYWAQENKAELTVNLGEIGVHGINHGANLNEFELGCRVIHETQNRKVAFAEKVMRRFMKLKPNPLVKTGFVKKVYYSAEIGYDKKLINQKNVKKIVGYFQTYKYFDGIVNPELKNLNLKSESDWFTKTRNNLELNPFVAIHIRRGDFKKFSKNVGLLSDVYYNNAICKIDQCLGRKLPLIVFSDEIALARLLLKDHEMRVASWISPPRDSSPIESLVLMSGATAIVIANSTFSWWAARLGRTKQVVAPEQWFRTEKPPKDLYPSEWHLVPSDWED